MRLRTHAAPSCRRSPAETLRYPPSRAATKQLIASSTQRRTRRTRGIGFATEAQRHRDDWFDGAAKRRLATGLGWIHERRKLTEFVNPSDPAASTGLRCRPASNRTVFARR